MIPYANRQRNIARLALQAAGAHSGFALAGSGAIREHGLIDRPTEDVEVAMEERRVGKECRSRWSPYH